MHLAREKTCRDTWHMDESTPAKRVEALRLHLGLSQDLADRGGPNRTVMNKIENGGNELSGAKSRAELARAFGVDVDTLNAYLDERIELGDVVRARAGSPPAPGDEGPERAAPLGPSLAAFEQALKTAFLSGAFEFADLDAVRVVLREGAAQLDGLGGLDELAVAWLRGAARLRRLGRPVSALTLSWAGAVRDDAMNAEARAELAALGGEPPTEPVRTPPRGTLAVQPPAPVPPEK